MLSTGKPYRPIGPAKPVTVLLVLGILVSGCGLLDRGITSEEAGEDVAGIAPADPRAAATVDQAAGGAAGPVGVLRVATGGVANSLNPHDDQTPQ
jgi:hypothetical protein